MFSRRFENRPTSESTSRRFPSISRSLASASPARAFFNSSRFSFDESVGSLAVFTPQISTFPPYILPPPGRKNAPSCNSFTVLPDEAFFYAVLCLADYGSSQTVSEPMSEAE